MRARGSAVLIGAALAGGCALTPHDAGEPQPAVGRVVEFDHGRVLLDQRAVEFDGVVPIDVNDPDAPDVYLELVACGLGTREHESLVMTRARASDIHAGLLAIGLEPGRPGRWEISATGPAPVDPAGQRVRVRIRGVDEDGHAFDVTPSDWIRHVVTGERPDEARIGFVFAGSRMVRRQGREWYDADGTGCLIGLATFGSETIAWGQAVSPDTRINQPAWVADNERVPAFWTSVTVRIEAP